MPATGSELAERLRRDGYAVVAEVIARDDVARLVELANRSLVDGAGTRRMLDRAWCSQLALRLRTSCALSEALPPDAVPVLCTLFVKTVDSNWLVSLHQDLSIPVAERVSSARCSGWSEKEGELFVQPPREVLEQTLAVRLHLDDCDAGNGALRVVAGSHGHGRLTADEAGRLRDGTGEVVVPVPAGGAMLMRPLLLHASSKLASDRPRRVLHFVFGPATLPDGLRWR